MIASERGREATEQAIEARKKKSYPKNIENYMTHLIKTENSINFQLKITISNNG